MFNGMHDTVISNLGEAVEEIGYEFEKLEGFFYYKKDKKSYEIDLFGIRDGSVMGIEVKSGKGNGLKKQMAHFAKFAREAYPQKMTELYYLNATNGFYKCHFISPNINILRLTGKDGTELLI